MYCPLREKGTVLVGECTDSGAGFPFAGEVYALAAESLWR